MNSKRDESLYQAAGSHHLQKYAKFFEQLSTRRYENVSPTLQHVLEGPIRLSYKPVEDISLLSLVEMENKSLSKLLAAVAGTCKEIKFLKLEAKEYYKKISQIQEDDSFTTYLTDMQNLSVFVTRLLTVINLTTQQLSNSSSRIYLPSLIEHYLDLFIIATSLDEIIDSQPTMTDRWKHYRRQIRSAVHNPSQFGIPETKLLALDKLSRDLQGQLLKKTIFDNSVESIRDLPTNSKMSEQINCYLKNLICTEKNLIGANVGIILLTKLFGSCDKKLIKRVTDLNKKHYAITLYGTVTWIPIPLPCSVGEKILLQRTQKLSTTVNNLIRGTTLWCFEIQNIMLKNNYQVSDINRKQQLLMELLTLMSSMKDTIFTVTNLHATLSKPLYKSTVYWICRLIEIEKSLESRFHLLSGVIVQYQGQVLQHLSYQILSMLEITRKGLLQTDKGYSKERLDALSLIVLSMRLTNGPGTTDRRLLRRCALAYASQLIDCFKEEEILKLRFLLDNYDSVVELYQTVEESTDYSLLLYHDNIVSSYLSIVGASNSDTDHCVHLLNAFNDVVDPNDTKRIEKLRIVLLDNILKPACNEIETSLRLHVHPGVKFDTLECRIIRSLPFPIAGTIINPKRYIEHYLDVEFYNLTTVALHNWKTYKNMKTLATYKLNLLSVENHLPTQTYEQGLDALEMMRNIDGFVEKYLYNLNTQTFIEHKSTKRYLTTIGIRHISHSIRTHGNGIMSTGVNFVYQFLRIKLHTFSQFLYDEHIKSKLMRDIRLMKRQDYDYRRAEKFQKDIRKLGMTQEGMSYLDRFRQLITQIGNALGYVRLLRSGGLDASSNAVSFLPDIGRISALEKLCRELNYKETTRTAAKRLEEDIDNLIRNFTEGRQYFQLLVEVFSAAFRDSNSQHLKQFYAIVPPLTLSFVDNSVSNKEKMLKKNQTGAAFTDDGFAMGVAYINCLLNQNLDFHGLRWFEIVETHLENERIHCESNNDYNDVKLQQTKALTFKRLEERQLEFQLLYYSLSGARVFFKQPE